MAPAGPVTGPWVCPGRGSAPCQSRGAFCTPRSSLGICFFIFLRRLEASLQTQPHRRVPGVPCPAASSHQPRPALCPGQPQTALCPGPCSGRLSGISSGSRLCALAVPLGVTQVLRREVPRDISSQRQPLKLGRPQPFLRALVLGGPAQFPAEPSEGESGAVAPPPAGAGLSRSLMVPRPPRFS